MASISDRIVMEWRVSKNGKRVAVVPAGRVQVGDVLVGETRYCTSTAPGDGWAPTGSKNGYGEAEYRRVNSVRVSCMGAEFRYRGYYMDEEDALSVTGQHRAIRVPASQAQYAYLESV